MEIKTWKFPAGEVGVRLVNVNADEYNIHAPLGCSDDFMMLVMTVDAIRRATPHAKITVFAPYIPYGRQDRVCNRGESLSIAAFAGLLNSLRLDKIITIDTHSAVTDAVVNNLHVIRQDYVVARMLGERFKGWLAVAPDAGAAKKVIDSATAAGITEYVVCNKTRDLMTGKITDASINGDVSGRDVIVFDDLCDGGATFIEVAKLLREGGAAKILLYVTHGIFTKGVEAVAQHFDHVYTTNSYWHDVDVFAGVPNITVLDVYKEFA